MGQTKYFKFYNDTDSVGNKSVIVNVKSNDSTNSDVYIQFVYSVAEQSKITFTEGASASATQTERTLDELVDFGFVDKGRNIKKYYNISNTGIYKNLIINSINSTVSDINVGSLPSLPYTLQKNATNTLSFEVEFLTSTSGLKEGSLIIDYTEGAADAPATPVKPNNAISITPPVEEF